MAAKDTLYQLLMSAGKMNEIRILKLASLKDIVIPFCGPRAELNKGQGN